MERVNIYTYSTAKSPKAAKTQGEIVAFVIEYESCPEDAQSGMKKIQGMSQYQSELYVLERALTRITTRCDIHIYTESSYVAAGYVQGWLEFWKTHGWRTKTDKKVSNIDEWKALDAIVQQYGHALTFHVKEDHAYRKWLKTTMEKEKKKCLKNLENSTQQKR